MANTAKALSIKVKQRGEGAHMCRKKKEKKIKKQDKQVKVTKVTARMPRTQVKVLNSD